MNLIFIIICVIINYIKSFNKKFNYINKPLFMYKTIYPDPERNSNPKKKLLNNYNIILEKPLYTLIWYDCEKCKKLLDDMDKLNLKNIYINGGYYFYDITNTEGLFDDPLLYKDDDLIGDNLFDIYNEIYKN